MTAAVLEVAPDLLPLGAFCIGTNQIDLGAAPQCGIAAFDAPSSNDRVTVVRCSRSFGTSRT